MKSRPILFTGPMVRALLDGSKTQTRRIVKPKIAEVLEWSGGKADADDDRELDELLGQRTEANGLRAWCADYPEEGSEVIRCPYGQPGDQLWVRESFRKLDCGEIDYHADGREVWERMQDHIALPDAAKWKPSIHMPRWASRITLEITGVRLERLQYISEADAIAEGIERFTDWLPSGHWKRYKDGGENAYVDNPIASYASLWTEINGPGSWEANPWVWVVEFNVKGG